VETTEQYFARTLLESNSLRVQGNVESAEGERHCEVQCKKDPPLIGKGSAAMMNPIAMAEYLTIGVVPKHRTNLFVKSNGTIAPAPPKPMIEPQTSLLTCKLLMNSGILGIQERAATPWVKNITIRANCARLFLSALSITYSRKQLLGSLLFQQA
jgi:hypothetical protein